MKTRKLSTKHTSEELAEAIVFPVALTASQKKEAAEQLAAGRKKGQQKMTENDRFALQLFQLKFRLEDYIQNEEFNSDFTFGYFLRQYVDLLHVKRKEFADQIGIDESLLSQFINMHRMPPDYIVVRLEIHSNNVIPATSWFKLVEKQREHTLKTDKELRRTERKHVRGRLTVSRYNLKIRD